MHLFKTKNRKTEKATEKKVAVPRLIETAKDIAVKSPNQNITGILQNPHITEKSAGYGEGKYVFSVAKSANKIQVKQAVESRYGVSVRQVRIINLPDKARRRGKQLGWKSGIKKAVIFLKKGEKIEIQ